MRHTIFHVALLTALVAWGCGDDADSDSDSADSGTNGVVTAAWADFCVATFTADYAVESPFGEVWFTARAGDAYLMSRYSSFMDEPELALFYLSAAGPLDFSVDPGPDGEFPRHLGPVRGSCFLP